MKLSPQFVVCSHLSGLVMHFGPKTHLNLGELEAEFLEMVQLLNKSFVVQRLLHNPVEHINGFLVLLGQILQAHQNLECCNFKELIKFLILQD